MLIARGVLGGILLFLGRELNFLLAGGMAALLGFRLTPLLPDQWPAWSTYAFIASLAVVAALATIVKEHFGYSSPAFWLAGIFLSNIMRRACSPCHYSRSSSAASSAH